jgi:DNA replication protein DnaC
MARPDCPECLGTGWKMVPRRPESGQDPKSISATSNSDSGVWSVPCECTENAQQNKSFVRARIPERYRHCDFDNFESDLPYDHASPSHVAGWNKSLEQAKVVVRSFARDFPSGTEHGILLMGTCGVGKTHLAIAALQELTRRGHNCLYYDYRELLKEIQDSYNSSSESTEMGVLDPVLKAEVLLLDDLGSSKPSLWALETVAHILNTRYNDKRVTLVTTNFLDGDSAGASQRYSNSRSGAATQTAVEDSLTDRVGARIRSRLYEMCRTIEIIAPDYRKEIRQASRFRS